MKVILTEHFLYIYNLVKAESYKVQEESKAQTKFMVDLGIEASLNQTCQLKTYNATLDPRKLGPWEN